MSSDKTKSDKGYNLLNKLYLDPKFRRMILRIREDFGIPMYGFTTKENIKKWFSSPRDYGKFIDAYLEIVEEYNFSSYTWNIIENFILSADRSPYWESLTEILFCERGTPDTNEERFIKKKIPFVKIIITQFADRKYTKNFIDENWKYIKKDLEKQLGRPIGRLRTFKNSKRDDLIRELFSKSKEELGRIAGKQFKDRKFAVSYILKTIYNFPHVEPETVLKVAYKKK